MFRGLIDFSRSILGKRNLEAAGGGRRWANVSAPRDAKNYVQAGAATVSARAQLYVLNNAHGARAVNAMAGAAVGTGIVPRPQHESEVIRGRLARDFNVIAEDIDADGMTDFYGLQDLAFRDTMVFGESLFSFTADLTRNGAPSLRRLHPEQLDRAKTMRLADGGAIVHGVEFDPAGRRRAYWIHQAAPGDALGMTTLTSERYAATSIIHQYRSLVPGQARGLSWFAPVLLPAATLDKLLDAMLVRAQVSALFVGSICDVDGSGAGLDGEQKGGNLDVSVEPGAIRVEQPGKRLEWSEPPTAGDAPVLARDTLRMIAAGLGTTYEQLTGDYSQVNYSSARAAQLEFRRFIEMIQHHVIVHQFCRPVWKRFIAHEVLRGVIPAAAYQADRNAFEAVKWLPPAWPSIDPSKDADAAQTRLRNNLTSRSAEVAADGFDIEALDKEIAADAARAKRLGLVVEVDQTKQRAKKMSVVAYDEKGRILETLTEDVNQQ